ncbi:MAG: tyrosine--tRNA ligase, partial [Flavobacterium sp.]
TIDALIAEHQTAPHLRVLQKRLAEEVTVFVHGREELEKAIFASGAFFSPTMDDLKKLDTKTFLEVFEGVPQAEVEKADIENGLDMIAALSAKTGFLASNSEARRELQQNAISLNKEKVAADYMIAQKDLINGQFLMLQKGKKNYYLIKVI